MNQILGSLREIPLKMAAEPRVIIEDAQYDRTLPPAAVLGVYARENGKGMLFPDEGPDETEPPQHDSTSAGGKPSLKIVK